MLRFMQVVIAITPEAHDGPDELAEALQLAQAHRAAGHYVVVDGGEYASGLARDALDADDGTIVKRLAGRR